MSQLAEAARDGRARLLFRIGGAIFAVMGGLHGIATLVDVFRPTFFTPVDDRIREAMIGQPIGLSSRADLWAAWLGFNLSHSLGLVFFGLVTFALTRDGFALVRSIRGMRCISTAVAATYLVLALRFWFYAPALGAAVALACFMGSALASRERP